MQISHIIIALESASTLADFSLAVAAQINELHTIREKVYGMEQAHIALKAK